jgi:hypothetical protein
LPQCVTHGTAAASATALLPVAAVVVVVSAVDVVVVAFAFAVLCFFGTVRKVGAKTTGTVDAVVTVVAVA